MSYLSHIFLIESKSRKINIVFDFSLNQGSFISSGEIKNYFLEGGESTCDTNILAIQHTHTDTQNRSIFYQNYVCF